MDVLAECGGVCAAALGTPPGACAMSSLVLQPYGSAHVLCGPLAMYSKLPLFRSTVLDETAEAEAQTKRVREVLVEAHARSLEPLKVAGLAGRGAVTCDVSSKRASRRGSPAGLKGCTSRRAAVLLGRLARHRYGIMRVRSAAGAGAVSVAWRRLQRTPGSPAGLVASRQAPRRRFDRPPPPHFAPPHCHRTCELQPAQG